ncbi:MAG TPA: DUF2637 domain-containing protein [Pseudonocardia sp.]|nr:DUF2637 domain-containing protein [Pseudonocardia sp.]
MSPRVWPAATLGVIVVTAVGAPAAVASYRHARTVVERSGDVVMAPWLALTTDGMLLAALVVIWVRRLAGRRVGAGPWAAFWTGMIATVAANLAAAQPTVEGLVVALWPPVCLAITLELVALLLVPSRSRAPDVARGDVALSDVALSDVALSDVAPSSAREAVEPTVAAVEDVEDTAEDTGTAPARPRQEQRRVARSGAERRPSDEEIASEVRQWGADPEKPTVTRASLMREFKIGSNRASRVLRMVRNPEPTPTTTPTPIRRAS